MENDKLRCDGFLMCSNSGCVSRQDKVPQEIRDILHKRWDTWDNLDHGVIVTFLRAQIAREDEEGE